MSNHRNLIASSAVLVALSVSSTASLAGLGSTPGETSGTAAAAPLTEGLYATDIEIAGRRDVDADHNFNTIVGPVPGGNGSGSPGPGPNIAINEPTFIYSTPFNFYNTRLEFVYDPSVISSYGGQNNCIPSAVTNRTDVYDQTFGPVLAHSFGNGFSASISGFVRPPAAYSGFMNHTFADIRSGISYTANGYDLTALFKYNGTFGGYEGGLRGTLSPIHGVSDAVDLDFTATKKLGRFEFGLVGYAFTDINTRGDDSTILRGNQTVSLRTRAVGVGGLVGYNFGRVTLQAYVIREVFGRNQEIVPTVGGFQNLATNGYLRLIVPLYVPAAPKERVLQKDF